ncbi:NHLP bacteriocin export ABC transporter permease/ATPase subunit [Candidatus Methylospira mobilis]|uniref:NHLP bacteriocin export ABC transporter permease/ATPase subunit n=1 Tax=Candidatus Methylospira mobilis TaxID=1808979 RepID=A0A5Q0BI40_9GAMM|nr:NHLP bacteriocin export ABC transporter permease/ATPase subunit [Candidatus Methylospira mobilis]QFY43229.1 NHLP bacteriocin export ABC transporter permease/ATPase subunit [Candidatus Methylospira mobilis]
MAIPEIGEYLVLSGNKPWLLHGPERVWLVTAGAVDIHVVPLLADGGWGARQHLRRVSVDGVIMGLPSLTSNAGFALIAQPLPGSCCRYLDEDACRHLQQDVEQYVLWRGWSSGWVQTLGNGLSHRSRPRENRIVTAGSGFSLSSGGTAYASAQSVVWVRAIQGEAEWLGRIPMVGDGCYPLTSTVWLSALSALKLDTWNTAELPNAELDKSLALFYACVMQVIAEEQQQERLAEHARQLQRAQDGDGIFARAIAGLAAVLQPGRQFEAAADAMETDPVFSTISEVLAATGIKAKHPPQSAYMETASSGLIARIARASGANYRQISLMGKDWWGEDVGPLLGFWKADGRPVAILPLTHGGYRVLDPANGTELRLNQRVAERLVDTAFMFFRTFPEGPITLRGLLLFGLKNNGYDWGVVASLGVISALLGLLTPIMTGMLINTVIPEAEHSQLVQLSSILLIAAISSASFGLTSAIALQRIEAHMEISANAAIIDHLLRLPVNFFREYTSGDLATRAFGLDSILQSLTGTVLHVLMSGLFSIFSFLYLFFVSLNLALVALLITVVAVAVTIVINLQCLRHERELTRIAGDLSGEVFQILNGIAKLRVAAGERHAFARWASRFSEQNMHSYRAHRLMIGLSIFDSFLPVVASMSLFGMMAFGSIKVDTGNFISFETAFTHFLTAGIGMGEALIAVLNVIPLYERMKPLLQTSPEVDLLKPEAGELSGAIELSAVTFRYDSKLAPVLDQFSLNIAPGEFVALVGPSGCGKSTLLRLLLGFEKPESGSVYYDNQDIAGLDIVSIRKQIGVVLQHGRLMPGDIFTNIVGSAILSYEDAMEAARMAGMEEDLKAMPMGLHTVVDEGAGTLSGGQRQRLMIARALVSRPRILFFDEATSALDNRTQQRVSESIERLNATRVVVAHRLSTIRHADRIIMMESGKIVEMGRYEELMNRNGRFAELAKRQLA